MNGSSSTNSGVLCVTTKSRKFQKTGPASLCRTWSRSTRAMRGQSGAISRSKHTIRILSAETHGAEQSQREVFDSETIQSSPRARERHSPRKDTW